MFKSLSRVLALSAAVSTLMAGSIRALDLKTGGGPGRVRSFTAGRSKYVPHVGKKERARFARWPDGKMHVTGHERRAMANVADFRLAA